MSLAVLYRYRAGIPWRDLPERFGDFRVVHTRFSRWTKSGVWQQVFEHLTEEADNEDAMIDATIVRAHQPSAGAKGGEPKREAIGRSQGGLSTKIHATCDALGNPTGFHLTPGQAHDLSGADELFPDLDAEALLADKAYDATERVLKGLEEKGCQAVIPPKSNRKQTRDYDRELYKARHLIENFFAKLKRTRVRNATFRTVSCPCNIARLPLVMIKPLVIFWALFIWRLRCSGLIDDTP